MSEPFGRYQLLKRIAGGGMGEVFLARQAGIQGFEKLLVIKTLLPHLTENEEFVQMFLDEARLAARLNHPNLISIFDLGQEQDVFYIAMDYVHGEDLKRLWKQAYHAQRTIPVPIALRIVADAAAGLAFAHRLTNSEGNPLNLVHRDVSPQNILITFDGGVKLIDFGVAKAAGRMTQTQTGALKGKYAYMSPEQVDGQEIDRRSDIFALGIVLWEMVTGSRLFRSDTDVGTLKLVLKCNVPPPSVQNPEVPKELDPLILRALTRDPKDRYQDMDELRLALENWLSETRSPGSSAHLAGFMRELFKSRLEREGSKGPLADVDPDASGFSPFGNTRAGRARPKSDTSNGSSQSLMRPPQPTGDLVTQPAGNKLSAPLLAMGGVGLVLLGVIAYALLRPHEEVPHPRPQPVVEAPTSAPLNVSSTPPGAELRVDGQVKGLTPVQNLALSTGKPVRIELLLAGYQPVVQEGVSVPANLSFTLLPVAPARAELDLRSEPAGATVYLDGKAIGTTPAKWSADARGQPVTLTFKLKGYHARELQVTPGKDAVAEATLLREKSGGSRQSESAPAIKMSR